MDSVIELTRAAGLYLMRRVYARSETCLLFRLCGAVPPILAGSSVESGAAGWLHV